MIHLTVDGLNPGLSETGVYQEGPLAHFHGTDQLSVGVFPDLGSVPNICLVDLLPIGRVGSVSEDPFHTGKK